MLLIADFLLDDAAFIARTLLSTRAARTASKRITSMAVLFPAFEGVSFFFFFSSSSSSSSLPSLKRLRSRSSVDTALSATWQLGFILGMPCYPDGAGAAVYYYPDPRCHVGAKSYGLLSPTWSLLYLHEVHKYAPFHTNHLSFNGFYNYAVYFKHSYFILFS